MPLYVFLFCGDSKVAHQKTILFEEFTSINKKINRVNRDLSNAIEGIREENFTEYGIVDILGSFVTMARDLVNNIVESQSFRDVVIGFNAKIQEIVKPMTAVYKSRMADTLKAVGKTYANMNLGLVQSEMVRSMNAMAESFSASKTMLDSLASTKALTQGFAASKVMSDSLLSTKALTQSFVALKILAESVKTAEMIQKSTTFPRWEHIDPLASYEDEELDERTNGGDEEE